jgi:hypothetical protein
MPSLPARMPTMHELNNSYMPAVRGLQRLGIFTHCLKCLFMPCNGLLGQLPHPK